MYQIVVLDGYAANPGDISWAPLEKLGNLKVYERTARNQILERIRDADFVYTNKVPIDQSILEQCPNLKWIGVLATGYNIIDIAYAKKKGIVVTNVPAYSSPTVVQNVFALLLHICHHVGDHAHLVSDGKWARSLDFCFWDYPQIELADKTLGIVGFGDIGKRVAKTAESFNMNVLVHTPHPDDSLVSKTLQFTDLETLLTQSDVISLHCPLTDQTRELINRSRLQKMKPSAILINTGRGPLIHESDLADALNNGEIYAAGLDVLSQEPPAENNPLFTAKNCYITPHVSWSSKEARIRLHEIAFQNLRAFLEGNPIHVVNL